MSSGTDAPLRVDIVVNNHNYGRFIAAAIESACAQSYPHVNVIVVDDGSTDDSREVIARYAEQVDVVLKDCGGQASAINAGLTHCDGDIVLFLDSDDVLDREAAARVTAAFAADERLVKVQFRTEIIDADGEGTGIVRPLPHLPMPNGDMRQEELTRPFDIVWMATSANSFRRSALAPILPIPEDAFPITGADWYLVHMTALLGPVRSLDEVSGYYRVHGSNSYEALEPVLDLKRVRQAVGYTAATRPELLRLAGELGLPHPAQILSTADIAYRMISLCAEPALHPVEAENRIGLLRDGLSAIRRRDDVGATEKAMQAAWFMAMAASPPPLARRLGEYFLFPETRTGVNELLERLQAGRRRPQPDVT
jgi:hypothetical protein